MFWKSKHEDFIQKYKIDKSITTQLIKFFKKTHFGTAGRKKGKVGEYETDTVRKDSTDLGIVTDHVLKNRWVKEYYEELEICLELYKKKYNYSNYQQSSFLLEGGNIQEYKPNQGYKIWHYENNGCDISGKRHLVYMTYLNDCPHAGTEFFYQNKRYQCKAGDTLIWPAAWTHTHKGEISKKQTKNKYIITGWWRYAD